MDIKYVFNDYFHFLYRSLRFLDQESKTSHEEEVIHMMKQNVDKLNAFINMLSYVDPTIPLLRCQSAIASFHRDLLDLHRTVQEEKLIEMEAFMYGDAGEISGVLSVEEGNKRNVFQKQVRELFLNTIHATERLTMRHINGLNNDHIKDQIIKYFEALLESVQEHMLEEDYQPLASAVEELFNNFILIHRISPEGTPHRYGSLIKSLDKLRKEFNRRNLYVTSINKIDYYGYRDNEIKRDLLAKLDDLERALQHEAGSFENLKQAVLGYLKTKMWASEADDIHVSVAPVNTRDTLR